MLDRHALCFFCMGEHFIHVVFHQYWCTYIHIVECSRKCNHWNTFNGTSFRVGHGYFNVITITAVITWL